MADYFEVDRKRDEDLSVVVVVTSCRKSSGFIEFSWSLFKEFQVAGEVRTTSYLNDRHFGAARGLLDWAESRIREEKERLHQRRRLGARSERTQSE